MTKQRAQPAAARGLPVGSFRDLLRVLFRHKWKMLVAVGVAVAAGIAAAKLSSPVFRSEARLMLRVGRESVALDPTAVTGGQTVGISQTRQSEIQSELTILNSRAVFERLAKVAGVERLAASGEMNDAIDRIEKATRAFVLPDTNIIALHFDSDEAGRAQSLLAEWIDLFRKKHLEVHRTAGSYEFFESQTKTLAARIETAEQTLKKLQCDSGVFDGPSQRQSLIERERQLQSQLEAARLAVETAKARIAVLENQDPSGAVIETLRQRLVDAELSELDLAAKYKPDTQRVIAAREKVRGTLELLERVGGQRVAAALAQARGTLAVEEARQTAIGQQLAELRTARTEFIGQEQELTRLQARLRQDRANYDKYVASLEQARIDTALERARISNISIAQPPTLPGDAIRPRPSLYLAIAILVGCLAALGVAFGAEAMDPSLRVPDRAANKTGLRCLGSVPRDRRLTLPRLVDLEQEPRPRTVAALDEIAAQLLASGDRVVAVAAGRAGDGASTVAVALARRIALVQPAVLLVDADFAGRDVSRAFDMSDGDGLASVFDGAADRPALLSSSLGLLPAGEPASSTLGRTHLETAEAVMLEWRRQWGFVIVDVGDVVAHRSRGALAARCDSTVLVADAERTRWQVVSAAVDQLQSASASMAGVVLNRRRYPIPSFLYRLT